MKLEELGFTKEELQNRVVDKIVESIFTSQSHDEDGHPYLSDTYFKAELDNKIKERIDATVAAMAEKHVLPNVTAMVENLSLQETNKWGEATGEKLTFIEYLTKRAESYMLEQVNYEGKGKSESSYGWTGTQTRLTHLVHHHLHYSIEQAMKEALRVATSSIVTGIEETAKLKLQELSSALRVAVTVNK